jgi:hypothetical protein
MLESAGLFYYWNFTPRFAGRDCGAGEIPSGQASRFTAGLLRMGDLTVWFSH